MPQDELAEEESRRWAEIIEMSLNLEQASDIVERMGSEIADKSLAARRAFSVEGLKSLKRCTNSWSATSSWRCWSSSPATCRARAACAATSIASAFLTAATRTPTLSACISRTCRVSRPAHSTWAAGDMKRLNSLFCAVAYSVMEQPDEDDQRDEY